MQLHLDIYSQRQNTYKELAINSALLFIVVYDMTTDGSNLDEKIMISKEYLIEDKKAFIGTMTGTPTSITTANSQNKITLSYNLVCARQ